MQKEITVVEVKQLANGAVGVKDAEDTNYFCKDSTLASTFKVGSVVVISYEKKTSQAGKPYNNITASQGKGQSNPAPTSAPTPNPEVSGPEHGIALKLVGDLYIGGKLTEDNPLVQKMWAELRRILVTKR